MFSLIKIVYLIRVFRQLNFLVTMFNTVVNEIFYFMILFCIFLLTFAQSFSVVGVDIESYGRTPNIVAHFISVLRLAMGDFSMIDPKQGFDIIDEINEDGTPHYRHSNFIMLWTFFIFVICIFFMFMIFMNFIIAVIGESYSKVIMNKEAFDYQQRAVMIYEREVHFTQKHFEDDQLFPGVIIVRRVKDSNSTTVNNIQTMSKSLKAVLKSSF